MPCHAKNNIQHVYDSWVVPILNIYSALNQYFFLFYPHQCNFLDVINWTFMQET